MEADPIPILQIPNFQWANSDDKFIQIVAI